MLVAKNISKSFSGVRALSNVNFSLHGGKVNAIIGENGAGKSTLMKVLSGVHTAYDGEIKLDGKVVKFANAKEAEIAGIAIIHQELNLVPHLTVAENIFLGREHTNTLGLLDKKRMNADAAALLQQLNLMVDPGTKVETLRVGQQQLIEIAKALHTQARIIIMDEPTSAITDKEVENLFTIIAQLKAENKAVVYVSHKMKELFAIGDYYTVLRDGCSVAEGSMKDITVDGLIDLMAGRKISIQEKLTDVDRADEVLLVKGITLGHPARKNDYLLRNISFSLHKGEILGLYGLMGAGRTELLECLFGLHHRSVSGQVFIHGKRLESASPSAAIAAGIAMVPEDRKVQGAFLDQSVKWNISLSVLHTIERLKMIVNRKGEEKLAAHHINKLSIKSASVQTLVKNLSGGNQQKVVLAKWLSTHPQVLLLDEPTRGVDINAKREIYLLMHQLSAAGMAILMVSSELPEILAVSNRVLVMCEGEITANIAISEATEANLLKYAIQKK